MAPITRGAAAAAAYRVPPVDDSSTASATPRASSPPLRDPAFEHVLFLIGCGRENENPDHPLRRCLLQNDVTRFRDLFTITNMNMDHMAYTMPGDADDAPYNYLSHQRRTDLMIPAAYRSSFNAVDPARPMTMADWLSLTPNDIDDFCISDAFDYYMRLGQVLPLGSAGGPTAGFAGRPRGTATVPTATSEAELFKKSVKRELANFTVFSDRRLWGAWHLQFKATARAQGLYDVLDPDYVPKTSADTAVFKLKNDFMYSVFASKLQTDEGRTLVRHYEPKPGAPEPTSHAQELYAALLQYYTNSTHAELSANSILTFLTTFKLGTDRWKGGTVTSFLTYFLEQVRLYDDMMTGNRGAPLTDDFKRTALDSAVQSIPELRQVRITQHTLCRQLNTLPTFEEYFSLLETAATVYDSQQVAARHTPRPSAGSSAARRNVYWSDVSAGSPYPATAPVADYGYGEDFSSPAYDDAYDGYDPEPTYDRDFTIDTPLSTVTAFAASQTRRRPPRGPGPNGGTDAAARLDPHIFTQLTREDRTAWARLTPEARRLILGGPASTPGDATPPAFKVHAAIQSDYPDTGHGPRSPDSPEDHATAPAPSPGTATPTRNDQTILTMLTDRRHVHHPGDVRRLLSNPASPPAPRPPPASYASVASTNVTPAIGEDFSTSEGHRYRRIHMATTYAVANAKAKSPGPAALIDRGANGGLCGADCRILARSPDRFVNVEGIDKHQLTNIPIVSCGAYSTCLRNGPVILVFHQFAGMMRGPTILSAAQLEAYGNQVHDRARTIDKSGQRIITNDGFEFPLHIRQGLPYIDMRPYTDTEWDTLPHVIMTSDVDWDPAILDGEFPLTGQEPFFDARNYNNGTNFDAVGSYRKGTIVASARTLYNDPILQTTVLPDELLVTHEFPSDVTDPAVTTDLPRPDVPKAVQTLAADPDVDTILPDPPDDITPDETAPAVVFKNISPHVAPHEPDPETLRPFFAFLPTEIVRRTLQATTQYARVPMSDTTKRFYKSPFPALNVARRNEDLLTDVIYSDTPAIDDGSTSAAIYSGKTSHVMDVYGMKTDKQFVNTLEDIIRDRGAPTRLLSDHAITLRSGRILDILRAYCIGQWTSEPHHQNQNTMERRYQTAKRLTNVLMDRSGCPPSCWLLCLQYVCTVLNCTVARSLNWRVPLTVLTGTLVDVSPLLRFHWYQPVFYTLEHSTFPSESKEALGYFVGLSPNCGHAMTFKVLTADTHHVIPRSLVRPADDPKRPNLRLTDLFDGETPSKIYVRSRTDPDNPDEYPALDPDSGEIEHDVTPSMVNVDTSDLIGKTFLMDVQEDGTRQRARIVEMIGHNQNSSDARFRCKVGENLDEIIAYNDIIDYINKDVDQEVLWRFKRITGHQGPLNTNDANYKGAQYNVQVEWENGEITFEPLTTIATDDPVSCAIYARDNGLLDTPGWKRFKRIAKNAKKLLRMANQAKLRSFRTAPRFKYGFEIPKDFDHAMFLDRRNGNTKWLDANALEFEQLNEYDTFEDKGHSRSNTPPVGYKKIRVHLVFDVKHDGRHKVRCVADGHLTEIPLDSVYSGVVSLRGLRIVIFLSELNGLAIWATDIGNAYLEAITKEKLYIIAGPEFGPLQGHILVIRKALYGLRSSGKRWHERFSDCLRSEGFEPCKAEPDIWIRPSKDKSCYEMVAVYVDDLAIGMKDPEAFLSILIDKYKFKLKGSGPISFHLGCDFERDEDGTLCMVPRQYIERIVAQYERMFGSKPRTHYTSPLEKNDHPEEDTSELLDEVGVQQYQSLIGSLQWAISLGRFDITTAVMTLSSFRSLPRKGHLDRAKRVVSYIYRFKYAKVRFRTHEPDFSDLVIPEYDWSSTAYGTVREAVPHDAPTPLGKPVVTVSYVDANLLHCLNTGRSVTGILHFLNGTPIDWYSKKMATVETATYGAEFVSARTCVEQLVDLRTTLRYLGVPIRERSYMFGDNESVVNSAILPHAKLHKRHNALSFHRVREAIASGNYAFIHIPGENNPADILSKHWGYSQVWHMLRALFMVSGDTIHEPGKQDSIRKPGEPNEQHNVEICS